MDTLEVPTGNAVCAALCNVSKSKSLLNSLCHDETMPTGVSMPFPYRGYTFSLPVLTEMT